MAGGELALAVGTAFDTLATAHLTVPDGEHVLVAGPARSGRTTSLARLAAAWRDAHPDGVVVVVAPRHRDRWAGDVPVADVSSALAVAAGTSGPVLLVVDDAERVEDRAGGLAALVAERRPGLLVVAAGRPDGLRPHFGHWTGVVRRSRLGLLLAACADVDGDLLGELLPRQRPLPPRPGLAWLIDGGGRRLVQVAS
jgi:S-DNA-T family DNA segregation ATPase FtsK/SpoIIIE